MAHLDYKKLFGGLTVEDCIDEVMKKEDQHVIDCMTAEDFEKSFGVSFQELKERSMNMMRSTNDDQSGIVAIQVLTPNGIVLLD